MGKWDVIQWTRKSTNSVRDKQPVNSCFGLYPQVYTPTKLVYKAAIICNEFEKPEVGVVKARRYRPGTERYWQGELDQNRYAHQVATAFTDQTLAARIEIVDQYLAPLHRHTSWDKVCLKLKPRYFRQLLKFEIVLLEEVVRDLKPFKNDIVLDAFSHFSYSESNGENMLNAFQGNKTDDGIYLLLTPDMLTHKYDIHKWFEKHTCNDICGKFKKPPSITETIQPMNIPPTDNMFFNFQNDSRPPSYEDDMSRDAPNEKGNDNANLETTFGAKSCDGSFSVVTALVHSDSFGKNKPLLQEQTCNQVGEKSALTTEQLPVDNVDVTDQDCLDGRDSHIQDTEPTNINLYRFKSLDEDKQMNKTISLRSENLPGNDIEEIEVGNYDMASSKFEATTLVMRPNFYSLNVSEIGNEDNVNSTEHYVDLEKKEQHATVSMENCFGDEEIPRYVNSFGRDLVTSSTLPNQNGANENDPSQQYTSEQNSSSQESSPLIQQQILSEEHYTSENSDMTQNHSENSESSFSSTLSCEPEQPTEFQSSMSSVLQPQCQNTYNISQSENISPFTHTEQNTNQPQQRDEQYKPLVTEEWNSESNTYCEIQNAGTISLPVTEVSSSTTMEPNTYEHDISNESTLSSLEMFARNYIIPEYDANEQNNSNPFMSKDLKETTEELMPDITENVENSNKHESGVELTTSTLLVKEEPEISSKAIELKNNCINTNPTDCENVSEREVTEPMSVLDENKMKEKPVETMERADLMANDKTEQNSFLDNDDNDVKKLLDVQKLLISTSDNTDSIEKEKNERNSRLNSDPHKPSNPEFLIKYNLHEFVDPNENRSYFHSPNSTHASIPTTSELLEQPSSPHITTTEAEVVPFQRQKPLTSSLRSRKQKHKTKSVKFADDINVGTRNNINGQQTENELGQKPQTISPVIKISTSDSTETKSLEPINSVDANWYTHIPCECCDNQNITGRD